LVPLAIFFKNALGLADIQNFSGLAISDLTNFEN
jgi:hypothetical protein